MNILKEEEEHHKDEPSSSRDSSSMQDSSEESIDEEEEEEDEDEDDDDDEDEDSFEISDIEIKNNDSSEVKNLKIKLLKEKSKVMDAKETIESLVEQITAYKASVEEEKSELENKLKHEKKTKLEMFEIYKDLESERDNLANQLDAVINECEQLEREKQSMSKENITNLQTLMNEITNIEESNLALEKELEKERETNKSFDTRLQEQMSLNQRLESLNSEMSANLSSSTPTASDSTTIASLKKQLADAQSALAKEKEKITNVDLLMLQARRIMGLEGTAVGAIEQSNAIEISTLKTNVEVEKQLHHKTQLLLEEEKKKSDLNKKTADNLVARIKDLISSHHETLQQLDDEKENSKLLESELEKMKEQMNMIHQKLNFVNNNQQTQQLLDSESSTPTITQSPSSESVVSTIENGGTPKSDVSTPPVLDSPTTPSKINLNQKDNIDMADILKSLPSAPTTFAHSSPSAISSDDVNNSVVTTPTNITNSPTRPSKNYLNTEKASAANRERMYKTIRRNQTFKYINDMGGDLTMEKSTVNDQGDVIKTTSTSSVSQDGSMLNKNNSVKTFSFENKSNGSMQYGAGFNFTTTGNKQEVIERKKSIGSISKHDKKIEKEIKEISKKIQKEKEKEDKKKEEILKKEKKESKLSLRDSKESKDGKESKDSKESRDSKEFSNSPSASPSLSHKSSANLSDSTNNTTTTEAKNISDTASNVSVEDLPAYLQTPEAMNDTTPSKSGKDTATKRKSIWFKLNK